jgi:hypothetical protein
MKKTVMATAMALALSGAAHAQTGAPTCDDLVWSAQVLEANPDIALSCQGVYERDGELFAKVTIELTRVRGNRLTFRPLHTDGTKGDIRSITVPNTFRANIAGRSFRASELLPGQELSVYMPQDRFALAVEDDDFDASEDMLEIQEVTAAAVAMPTTASPLYSALAGALALLGLGAALTYRRRTARVRG